MSEAALDKALINKALWRIMPLSIIASAIAVIDRGNIGFAKLGMMHDIGLGEAAFGFGASLFFIGYTAFEVPSAMASHRFGARVWIARIMVTWGLVTMLLAFTQSQAMFYVLRFLLGVAEAGLYPAQLYYMTLWFPQRERVRAMGILTLGSALGNGFTALICGSLLDMNGTFGLTGWQWIFLVTGIFPIAMAFVVLRYLPNRPSEAKFFTAPEKARIDALLKQESGKVAQHGPALRVLLSPKIAFYGFGYALLLGSLAGLVYWAPTVLSVFNISGTRNGGIIAVCWAIDVVALLLLPPRLKSERAVLIALCLFVCGAATSLAAAVIMPTLTVTTIALAVGLPCASLAIACFWTIPVRHFVGAQSAAAIAAISTIGNLGNFTAQNAMPAIATSIQSKAAGLIYPVVCMGLMAMATFVAILTTSHGLGRRNRPIG